ncbi:hypothetical protein BC936DRAFT_144078 [Jimgerdemannia flammicorona]|uniref:Uncharacterized protein n=1 Tax=Jimgerdemannia flammicorona TaxID=994334 RepID=A0A433DD42_9FUNG|nr:hypothetical protein BC936DRAFT_144078 [Jimgerdemannia flammicorona]
MPPYRKPTNPLQRSYIRAIKPIFLGAVVVTGLIMLIDLTLGFEIQRTDSEEEDGFGRGGRGIKRGKLQRDVVR